jgi:hypothetical protein
MSVDDSRTNYDAFISRLYKYGSFVAYNNHVELKLRSSTSVSILTMIFLHSDTFSVESIEYNGIIIEIQPFISNNVIGTVLALSRYIGKTIYEEQPHFKIIQN